MAGKSKSTKTAVSKAASNINFKFKSIQTSSSEVIDFVGDKHYRTVFRLNEVETLFVDTEFINKQFDEKSWEAEIVAVLFYMNGKPTGRSGTKRGKDCHSGNGVPFPFYHYILGRRLHGFHVSGRRVPGTDRNKWGGRFVG